MMGGGAETMQKSPDDLETTTPIKSKRLTRLWHADNALGAKYLGNFVNMNDRAQAASAAACHNQLPYRRLAILQIKPLHGTKCGE
jgi:hypothetical protein